LSRNEKIRISFVKEPIMEKNKGWTKAGYVRILWAVIVILLCVPPMVWAYTEFTGGSFTVDYLIEGEVWVFPDASVTMVDGAHIANVTGGEEGNMYVAGIVNFLAGVVDGFIDVYDGTITVYGTNFADSYGPISTTEWTPAAPDYSDTLTGTYANGDPISLLFNSNTPIFLVDTGGGPGPEPITIDIKPGSYPNAINLGSIGVVPVAILSSQELDAATINPDTVFLAGSGVAVRGKGNKYLASKEDVNGDGLPDLVVKVETENLDPGQLQDGSAILKIHETADPESPVLYQGSDEITIVPP
jgi:hypothetical protein